MCLRAVRIARAQDNHIKDTRITEPVAYFVRYKHQLPHRHGLGMPEVLLNPWLAQCERKSQGRTITRGRWWSCYSVAHVHIYNSIGTHLLDSLYDTLYVHSALHFMALIQKHIPENLYITLANYTEIHTRVPIHNTGKLYRNTCQRTYT